MTKGRSPAAHCSEHVIHPAAVRAGRAQLPPDPQLEGMERFFKIMGDATRLRILHALLAGELCVCDIAETLGMSVSAVSHQLAVLKSGRLVAHRREGKIVYYRLSDSHVNSALDSIRTHVEEVLP
jgi:ArsR family transcriptional regulator, lead/cadmium/zinc/bismuth-responsive transcriptional repressor